MENKHLEYRFQTLEYLGSMESEWKRWRKSNLPEPPKKWRIKKVLKSKSVKKWKIKLLQKHKSISKPLEKTRVEVPSVIRDKILITIQMRDYFMYNPSRGDTPKRKEVQHRHVKIKWSNPKIPTFMRRKTYKSLDKELFTKKLKSYHLNKSIHSLIFDKKHREYIFDSNKLNYIGKQLRPRTRRLLEGIYQKMNRVKSSIEQLSMSIKKLSRKDEKIEKKKIEKKKETKSELTRIHERIMDGHQRTQKSDWEIGRAHV